jgi:hypothetical protein
MLFDNAEETAELTLGGRARSTPETQKRFAFLKSKHASSCWYEGARFLYRKGPQGSTVYDTWKLVREPLRRRGG